MGRHLLAATASCVLLLALSSIEAAKKENWKAASNHPEWKAQSTSTASRSTPCFRTAELRSDAVVAEQRWCYCQLRDCDAPAPPWLVEYTGSAGNLSVSIPTENFGIGNLMSHVRDSLMMALILDRRVVFDMNRWKDQTSRLFGGPLETAFELRNGAIELPALKLHPTSAGTNWRPKKEAYEKGMFHTGPFQVYGWSGMVHDRSTI